MSSLKKFNRAWHRFLSWKRRDLILLALMVLSVELANVLWRSVETRPPHWDMARHLWTSLNYLALVQGGRIRELLQAYYYYPPLLYWLVVPWYLLLGDTLQVAVAANLVFIAILTYSTYGIGSRLWSRSTGLLAAASVLSYPMLVTQFKEFQIDAPLTAMVALGLYLIIRTEEFRSLRYSILLGIALGLGMLTKWTYLPILMLPLFVASALGITLGIKERNRQRFINLAFTVLIGYAISSAWYITNLTQLRVDLLANGITAGVREGDPVIGTWASNTWYINILVNYQLYLIPLLAFATGLVAACRTRLNRRRNLYPLLLIAGTFVFFTLLRNKDARYTLPLLPAVAILATFWLGQLPQAWRRAAYGFFGAYALITFWLISFGWSLLPRQVTLFRPTAPVVLAQHGYLIGPPTHEQWGQAELFTTIKNDHSGAPKVLAYTSSLDTIWFNSWGLEYYSLLDHIPLTGKVKTAGFYAERTQQEPITPPAGYAPLTHRVLPDGSHLVLYRRVAAN